MIVRRISPKAKVFNAATIFLVVAATLPEQSHAAALQRYERERGKELNPLSVKFWNFRLDWVLILIIFEKRSTSLRLIANKGTNVAKVWIPFKVVL